MNKKLLLLTLLVLFTGCGKNILTLQERKATAFSLSKEQNLQERIYQTIHFNLLSYQTSLLGCENINVFIEGDGLAWIPVTYAGNLDTDKWTTLHKITPLIGSLNPADFTQNLQNLPQIHYVGIQDTSIPLEIFQSFYSKFTNSNNIKLILLDSTHANIAEKF